MAARKVPESHFLVAAAEIPPRHIRKASDGCLHHLADPAEVVRHSLQVDALMQPVLPVNCRKSRSSSLFSIFKPMDRSNRAKNQHGVRG